MHLLLCTSSHIDGIECSGKVQVTSISLNLSMRVNNWDRGMFSISMIPSRWWLPWKYCDNLQKLMQTIC